ncbi:molybdopterin-guanine dinucleotide biosynthesis protein B [Sporosarcina sp. ACRSM]|uniref:molybdopterin-guanine dinucleotide biosynthesis protein B n=1 Tax=Sporosarcina sp. ACRSM TaxID=2918216 RepID=UPI001EF72660|nr:molybdopterin-guanine dinucleotide biosynthesis protein B [Sporosarcina sp. ACRSM]MCG7334965.1 molybdopterin-guanine dinucleotide biosynthesis protein B [Sporosarcina sp. ACRSM]
MKTLHIVGFKNSGKTTLIARWVRLLKKEGLSVAVLKHHGHGGQPAMPDASTDTMQFFDNGADASVVAGGGAVQLLMNAEPEFTELKRWASISNPDILLIEGYKEQQGEKVVLLREREDWEALQSLDNIQLIVGCPGLTVDGTHITSRTEQQQLDSWLLDWVGRVNEDETI